MSGMLIRGQKRFAYQNGGFSVCARTGARSKINEIGGLDCLVAKFLTDRTITLKGTHLLTPHIQFISWFMLTLASFQKKGTIRAVSDWIFKNTWCANEPICLDSKVVGSLYAYCSGRLPSTTHILIASNFRKILFLVYHSIIYQKNSLKNLLSKMNVKWDFDNQWIKRIKTVFWVLPGFQNEHLAHAHCAVLVGWRKLIWRLVQFDCNWVYEQQAS